MPKKSTIELVPDEVVISKILLIRGKKVMIDREKWLTKTASAISEGKQRSKVEKETGQS